MSVAEAATIEANAPLKPYRNGKDLTDHSRNLLVIDCHGLDATQVRERYPKLYQWLLNRVKPERDVNKDKDLREKWWLHRRNNEEMRRALAGLPRYIATVMTAKHRVFQFLDGAILPDQMLVVIGLEDNFFLGVLSSQLHIEWALATGSRLGVGNDPRYNKSRCFETFPFPDQDTGLTPELRQHIASLAEQIDSHRKRVLGQVGATITLTGLYNVLTALREGRPLSAKEKTIHQQGLVSILRQLHEELDAAVLAAYGWTDLRLPTDTETLLQRLVTLNSQRATEEAQGHIRWLRPAFQNPQASPELPAQVQQALQVDTDSTAATSTIAQPVQQQWPATLPEQVRAVAQVLAASPAPLTQAQIEAHFKGRGPWKKSLPMLLQTLEALGRAQTTSIGGIMAWR